MCDALPGPEAGQLKGEGEKGGYETCRQPKEEAKKRRG